VQIRVSVRCSLTYTRVMSEHSHSHLWPGVALVLGSAALFGASTPVSKYLLGSISPWMLAGVLYLGAGIGLWLIRKLWSSVSQEASLQRTDYPWLAAVVLIGGIAGPLLLMFGLAHTSASQASLLLNLEGLATMALAWLVFKENVDRRLLLGAFAILLGAVVLTWDGGRLQFDGGAVLIAGACLAWGIDNNLTRKLSAADPVQIAMIKGLVAGIVNVSLAFAIGDRLPAASFIAAGAVVGFLGIGVSLVMFMLGLRHLGAARTGAYFSLAPFVGAVLAIGLLHEPLTVKLLIAGGLMAAGLWVHLAERHEHEHVHEEIEHDHVHTHDAHHDHVHEGRVTEPHSHLHRHRPIRHKHPHYPDLHHPHKHG
jgi:drug/metabolite transporter (DMT)-like permease